MRRQNIRAANMGSEEDQADETSLLKGNARSKLKATPCSRVQAPLQSWLRPAMWIPGLNRLHSHKEVWILPENTAQRNMEIVQDAVVKMIKTDKTYSSFIITKVEENFLQIHVFTRVEWLDVIEMKFEDDTVKILAFSSGFLPLCLPGACLLNVAFFWVPFFDNGMNKKRLMWIQAHLDVVMEIDMF